MVKVLGNPTQPFTVGVAVTVAVIDVFPELTPVNEEIFPVPLRAKPIELSVFVQFTVVLLTDEL